MRIFWSWQSDTYQPSGRHLVRAALEAAAVQLGDSSDLDDAERPTIDSDTSDVPGSPPIAETVLRKIRECAVFVTDVTPVGQTTGGKKLANPNVMIELGYALAQLGPERIVLVMNQAEGASLRALPFDLRHWRGPLTYSLSRTAEEDQRSAVLGSLTDDLVARLAPSLAYAASGRTSPEPARGVASDPMDPSIWEGASSAVPVRATHLGDAELPVVSGPRVYIRIIPSAPFGASRADISASYDGTLPLFPPGDYQDLWPGTSAAGAAAWNWDPGTQTLNALTQWFQQTGEIWAIWPNAFVDSRGRATFTDAHVGRCLEQFLHRHFATLTRFSAAQPWRVVIGVRGLAETHLPGRRYARTGYSGLAAEAHFEQLVRLPSEDAIRAVAFGFMRKVYDAYGAPNLDVAGYERILAERD
jgi:hypothetical protein